MSTGTAPIRIRFAISGTPQTLAGWKGVVTALETEMGKASQRMAADMARALATGVNRIQKTMQALSRAGVGQFAPGTMGRLTAAAEAEMRSAASKARRPSLNLDGPSYARAGAIDRLIGEPAAIRQLRAESEGFFRSFDRGIGGMRNGLRGVRDLLTSTASGLYLLKNAARGLDTVLVAPFRNLVGMLVDATEESRRFEARISGITGGLSRAHGFNLAFTRAAQSLPISMTDARDAALRMAYTPELSSQLTLGSTAQAAKSARDFAKLVSKLSLLDPAQGPQGATIAIREALAGDLVSLRRRFELPPSALAGMVGKRPSDLTDDPSLLMDAVQKYADAFVPDEVLDRVGNLVSVRLTKLRDIWRHAASIIGDSGLFDKIVSMLEGGTKRLFEYVDSPAWNTRAKAISANLESVLGNVAGAVLKFLAAISGTPWSDSPDPDRIAAIFQNLSAGLADFTERLPTLASALGSAVRSVAAEVIGAISEMRAAASNPIAAAVAPIRRPAIEWTAGIFGDIFSTPHYRHDTGLPSNPNAARPATRPTAPAQMPPLPPAWYETLQGDTLTAWADYTQRVRRVDDYPRLFGAMYRSAGSAIAGMPGAYRDDSDDFVKQYATGRRGLSIAGSAFEQVARGRDDMLASIEAVRRQLESLLASGTPHAAAIQSYIDSALPADRASVTRAYREQTQAVADALRTATVQWGSALADGVKDQAPHLAGIFFDRIARGTTDVAEGVRRALASVGIDAGALGFGGMDVRQQTAFLNTRLSGESAAIRAAARYGGIAGAGMDATALARLARAPLTETQTDGMLLAMYRNRLPDAAQVLDRARAAYAGSPSDLNLSALGKAQHVMQEILANVRDLEQSTNLALRSLVEFGSRAEEALTSSLGEAINGLITGTGSLRDALLGFSRDVTRAFSDMAARNLVGAILGPQSIAQGGPGVLSGLLGSLFGGGGTGNVFVSQHANGGYLGGSFMPFRAFANGGVAHVPTLGLIGEGAYDEAVVPLPDGKRIPVEMRGAGAEVNVYVVNDVHEAVRAGFRRNRDVLVSTIAGDIRKGGKTNKAIRRSPQ